VLFTKPSVALQCGMSLKAACIRRNGLRHNVWWMFL
jgi:hypothetical protein